MNLVLSLYNISDQKRKHEIEKAIELNLDNTYISRLIILNEGFNSILLKHKKIQLHQIDFRPTFNDLLQYCMKDEINIISNNDIYFDETLKNAKSFISNNINVVFALTRIEKNGDLFRKNYCDSQDSWIFWSNDIKDLGCFNFNMGVPGCDNRFAYELEYTAGLKVFNPSKTISTFHLHNSLKRNYSKNDQLKGNYLLLKPISIFLVNVILLFHIFNFLIKWRLVRK